MGCNKSLLDHGEKTELLIVGGIMVKNRHYIADKSVKFCRDFCYGLLIKKKIWPHVKFKP